MARLTRLAWVALLVERLAVALAPAAAVTGFFVSLSWTGVWLGGNGAFRAAGVALFLASLVASLTRLRRFSTPTIAEAQDALDAGHDGAPAATLADALANQGDARTEGLWRLHRRRAERLALRLRTVRPAPRLWRRDPHAVGGLAILALFATGMLAGPEKYARIAAAFDWRSTSAAATPTRIDAWIDPPAYTGKPPILLSTPAGDRAPGTIPAPVGSTIVVRAANDDLKTAPKGGVVAAPPQPQSDKSLVERRFVLRGDGALSISGGSQAFDVNLHAVPDLAPTITPIGPPKANLRGSFSLNYRIDDDYGAKDAQVSASLPSERPNGHPLFALPHAALDLPAAPGGLGEGKSTIDWSDSPYAGARVDLTLSVHDEGGNEGAAVVRNVVLPHRNLSNPLALALAEQRRNLAVDAEQRGRVLAAIDALMISPELFTPKLGVYLGLRHIHTGLRRARNDADLVAVADFMWEMALRIEDGDASQAERDLRAAEKALREALGRGAPPEEIARLTEQLKKAMDAFLAEMAKNAAQQPQAGESETGEGNLVTPKDFEAMLDRLTEAARDGDKNAAMDTLDRMREMLENLRAADKFRGNGKAAQQRKALHDLDKLSREQQKLRDDTFARQRGEPNEAPRESPQQQGKQDEQEGQADASASRRDRQDQIEQRQRQLREKLDALRQQTESPGKPSQGLAEAEQAMKEAEQALKNDQDAAALGAQGRALEGLRKGAGEMAKQAQQQGEGEAEEEGGQGRERGARGQNGEGPFGRPTRQNNVDATAAHKARKVLEELRRRLSDPTRARDELDYLERLIKPD